MTDGQDPMATAKVDTSFDRGPPPPDEPLRDVFTRLAETGKNYAEAEIDRQKSRAAFVGSRLQTVAILVLIALILTFGILITLMLGLVIALAPLITPLGATALVALVGLTVVALLLLAARSRIRSLFPKKAATPDEG